MEKTYARHHDQRVGEKRSGATWVLRLTPRKLRRSNGHVLGIEHAKERFSPMWLPKDERRLLAGYFRDIRTAETTKRYKHAELSPWLPKTKLKSPSRDKPDDGANVATESLTSHLEGIIRVRQANTHLSKRGLVELVLQQPFPHDCAIKLTIAGYDQGRKYSSWLISTGLWFAEYRHHWLWLILAYVVGVLSPLVVQWLTATP